MSWQYGNVLGRAARRFGALLLVALLPSGVAWGESIPSSDTQETKREQQKTLISGDVESGGFGGPSVTYTRLVGADVLMVGGRGAWLINNRVAVGGAVEGLIPIGAPFTAPSGGQYDLRMGYGGLWVEYILFPEQLLHGSVGTLVGMGWLNRQAGAFPTDLIFAVEPVAMLELNVTSFFRLGAGVSYRYVGSVNTTGLSSADLSGFGASIVLRFGRF